METVVLYSYVDNLVKNDDDNARMDSCGFIVSREWAQKMVRKIADLSLDEFLNEYTWDDTDGWIDKAVDDRALIGAFVGNIDKIIESKEA